MSNRYNSDMSYSQRKRSKLDYHKEYLKHNPGLFGSVWFCAYCGRAIVGEHNLHVDHIMPLNNPLGQNKRYNLVAACPACNLAKSDKVDGRVPLGYGAKVVQSILFGAQKVVVICFVAIYTLILNVVKLVGRLVMLPFRTGSIRISLVALGIYALIVYWLYSR